jgi:hypothetical protein
MHVKKMTAQLGLAGLMALAAALSMPAAHAAFGLPDIPIPGGAATASNVDVGSLLSQQKDLMGRFNQSMSNMLTAQALTLEAGGLKKQADLASATAANYKDGAVHSKDQIARDSKVSAEASKAIDDLMKKNTVLSADGQKKLMSAVPHYAKGMYEGTKLPQGFQAWTDSAKSGLNGLTADPMNASKLTGGIGDVATVATNLPALVSTWTTTSKAFLTYANSNKVDTTDLSSKMGDL